MRDEYLIADKYAGFLRAVDRLVGEDARLHLQVSYDFLSAWRDGLTPSEAAPRVHLGPGDGCSKNHRRYRKAEETSAVLRLFLIRVGVSGHHNGEHPHVDRQAR
jgi:hypothetical protein